MALFQPLVILPVQHFSAPRQLAPEHRLMIAVLNDAVWCLEKYRRPTDARSRRLFLRAKRWLLASEPDWPYSFECICAVLDLDASAVRHRLGLMPERPPVAVPREMQMTNRRTAVHGTHAEDKWNDSNETFGNIKEAL